MRDIVHCWYEEIKYTSNQISSCTSIRAGFSLFSANFLPRLWSSIREVAKPILFLFVYAEPSTVPYS